MKKWGLGIIGCGNIADFYIRSVQELDNAGVVAVSNRNSHKAESVGTREKCMWYTDYRKCWTVRMWILSA